MSQEDILNVLSSERGYTQTEIAGRLGTVRQGQISKGLSQLCKKKLARRDEYLRYWKVSES